MARLDPRSVGSLCGLRCEAGTMMTRKITIMALAGFVLGGAATEGFNVYRQSHDSRIFQERLRCKAVAEAYVKENSTDLKEDPLSGFTLTVIKADYSPARNSCVAELDTAFWGPRGVALDIFNVQDLISRETLFQARCTNCLIEQDRFADPAFDYVMKNASEPHELQESYYSFQRYLGEHPISDSKHPSSSLIPDAPASQHKSASPSAVTQWDAQGNPIPSKSPPKSARPSGSSSTKPQYTIGDAPSAPDSPATSKYQPQSARSSRR